MIRTVFLTLLAAVAILSFLLVRQYDKNSRLEEAYVASQDTVKVWQDKAGRSNAEIAVVKLSLAEAKRVEKKLLDSVKKVTGIKPKNIKSVVTVNTQTTDTVYLDFTSKFEDEWGSFELLDSSTLAYTLRDSIMLVHHNQKHGFLNLKSKYVIRAVSFNPHTTIKGLSSLELAAPKRRLGVGLFAGYGIMQTDGEIRAGWTTGVGLTFKIY